MARKSKSHVRDKTRDPLDDLDNETLDARPSPIPSAPVARKVRNFQSIEDRRSWAPGSVPNRPEPRDTLGRPARRVHKRVAFEVRRGPNGKPLQSRVTFQKVLEKTVPSFADARKAIICAKRKIRREVLHAFHRTKSGKGSPKRRNEWSNVEC